MMNVVGGVILLATALMILEIKRIPVANLLPAIFLVPPTLRAVERVSPGLLITLSAAAATPAWRRPAGEHVFGRCDHCDERN